MYIIVFFFNDTATTEIYTLSLHDALPIYRQGLLHVLRRERLQARVPARVEREERLDRLLEVGVDRVRSEEHTSELQSRQYLVCRLLLEKKKKRRVRRSVRSSRVLLGPGPR